ncbi:Uncharacterized protein HZ326_29053 [Fusarium oxysporum f. sp. albedinis]|nr:Uncharacterized protein HZ326_29053 [Fusarium oxysporum f. sp. albedinis]
MQNTKMTASAWHDEMKRGGGFTWYTLNQIIDVVLSWPRQASRFMGGEVSVCSVEDFLILRRQLIFDSQKTLEIKRQLLAGS